MRYSILTAFSLVLASLTSVRAQGPNNLGLVINVPSEMLSCQPASVQWIWTGSTADADGRTLSMAVEQVGSNNRRFLSEPSPIRHILKRSESNRMTHIKRAAINIAGGNNVPVTAGSWTWNSVGVPLGTYRMALLLDPDSIVYFSDHFTVSQGPDTSCLGSLGTSTASAATSTVLPALSMAAPTSTVDSLSPTTTAAPSPVSISSSSIVASSPTTSPQSTAQSNVTDQTPSSHHVSGGAIAAAVIIPLLVFGVLLYLCCFRRKNAQDASQPQQYSTKEKLTGFFNGGASRYNRQVSTPMDPIHTAGHNWNGSAAQKETQGLNDDEKIMSPSAADHWVDFSPSSPENDAAIVTVEHVEAMVRESMDGRDASAFYQLGQNRGLRQSGSSAVNRDTVLSDASSMPTYLREADFTSQHTHSSFGHDQNGNSVGHTASAAAAAIQTPDIPAGAMLERGNSKIRRKPAPTYSTYSTAGLTKRAVVAESPELPLPDSSAVESQGPFSDANRVDEKIVDNQEEVLGDSPTLPQERTPVNSSRSFPVSVYSTNIDSPSQRTLLETPREPLSEEERNRLYKLSIQMPQDDRGFRVSF